MTTIARSRIASIDLLKGLVMVIVRVLFLQHPNKKYDKIQNQRAQGHQ